MEKNAPEAAVLDDPGRMARTDPSGMFGLLARWPELWEEAASRAGEIPPPEGSAEIRHIVVSGMGGSAIGGDLLQSCLGDSMGVPLVVNRSYACPGFVGPDTLFVAVSYSGNTEETLSSTAEALERGARVAGITSGGRLREVCQQAGKTVFSVPPGLPPRQALGPLFLPTLRLLHAAGLAPDPAGAAGETTRVLADGVKAYGPDVPIPDNPAKALALSLHGKIPVVYGVQNRTDAVASRWRGQFHENSKNWAASNVLPELDHNEITSWPSLSEVTQEAVYLIFLKDREDGTRMDQRRKITEELISPHVSGSITVESTGKSRLARLFSLVLLGDFVSCYLAVLNQADPLPVPIIENLKNALAEKPPAE